MLAQLTPDNGGFAVIQLSNCETKAARLMTVQLPDNFVIATFGRQIGDPSPEPVPGSALMHRIEVPVGKRAGFAEDQPSITQEVETAGHDPIRTSPRVVDRIGEVMLNRGYTSRTLGRRDHKSRRRLDHMLHELPMRRHPVFASERSPDWSESRFTQRIDQCFAPPTWPSCQKCNPRGFALACHRHAAP